MIESAGVVGFHVVANRFAFSGTANSAYAINPLGSSGDAGLRTTDIVVAGNTFSGPLLAVVHLAGSYDGTGTASITDNSATGAARGLYCENITTAGQILGPIAYTGNALPAPQCGALVAP